MEKSVYDTGHQFGNTPNICVFLVLAFFPVVGIGLIVIMIVFLVSFIMEGFQIIAAYGVILSAGAALFMLAYGWVCFSAGLARYRFEEAGLVAKYPLRKEVLIPWSEFQQVCVCYAAYSTRGERRANTGIFCVKKGEKKTLAGRWKTDNLFRYKSVIGIDYKPEIYEKLQRICPMEVPDLRNTWEYRL